jgi:glycosyltransferase involved in cell wall biosynthesis
MAEAVLGLLKEPERRVEMGRRLQARVREGWSREAAVRKLKEVYETVLG